MHAAFLIPTNYRPDLLCLALDSLWAQRECQSGWSTSIWVSGRSDDPGKQVAAKYRARFVPCETGDTPGHKIETLRAIVSADLLMLADDDDIQSPNRTRAAIQAYTEGYEWSSTGTHLCFHTTSHEVALWVGLTIQVGTTLSVSSEAARKAGGWPCMPSGKDGLFAQRMKPLPIIDLADEIGWETIVLQHANNINQGRPFPEKGTTVKRGKFMVTGLGQGLDADVPPATRQQLVTLLESPLCGMTSIAPQGDGGLNE